MTWEYCVEDVSVQGPKTDLEDLLNELGRDGWELVGAIPNMEDGYTYNATLIFKRGEVKIDGK